MNVVELRKTKYYRENVDVKWGRLEYPLFNIGKSCPTARYVGGTSVYLCECREPWKCKGVLEVVEAVDANSRRDKRSDS